MTKTPLVILGHIEGRRVKFFLDALKSFKWPLAQAIDWKTFLDHPDRLTRALSDRVIFRIDSPGGDLELHRRLLAEGASLMTGERGEFLPSDDALNWRDDGSGLRYARQQFLGLQSTLQRVDSLIDPLKNLCVNPPQEILTLCDKAHCRTRFKENGIQSPPPLTPMPPNFEALKRKMLAEEMPRVFIKLRHGSSAAGIGALSIDDTSMLLQTSVGWDEEGPFSSLRLRRYTQPELIKKVIDWILNEGAIVERWLSKMTLDGREFDLRVLVIDRVAHHVVGRVSREGHPMTNLHLGSDKINASTVKTLLGVDCWTQTLTLCEATAASFSGYLCVGVDVMITPEKTPVIIEANAFGDLLMRDPEHRMNTYEAQLNALLLRPSQ